MNQPGPSPPIPNLAAAAAALIRDRFADYNSRFRAVTQRAQGRFETRDWAAARTDAVERIELYDRCASEAMQALGMLLGAHATDRTLWTNVRNTYAQLIASLLDQELNKTFFNTLSRRSHRIRGVQPDIEFVALDIEPTDRITHPVARFGYSGSNDLAGLFERVLADFHFAVPYAHATRCAERIAACLRQRLAHFGEPPVLALELLQSVFYRERRAYLVGRVFGASRFSPLVIVLTHDDEGIVADAVLTERDSMGVLFGYTRSYFHVDLETVGDAVVFLRTLLPSKPIDELYTVLGRAKQGKTERYRHFIRHLGQRSHEPFVHADGERGMVMAVFTLPSYPLVFKLIRDRFAFPKSIGRDEVRAKYDLVFLHDRVGRLVDAQEFRFLRFPRTQFAPAVRDELLAECSESVYADGEDLVLAHCYIERRLRPLNLYVREAEPDAARRAVIDYGQSIKDLACSNIFPGDLLLKNFGMSRSGRAIFYDYDELCLVTECRFRSMPKAQSDEEEMHHGAWFHVSENDVFPEQFPRFLGLDEGLLDALMQAHGEIFQVAWWQQVQARIAGGGFADVPPYAERVRLAKVKPA